LHWRVSIFVFIHWNWFEFILRRCFSVALFIRAVLWLNFNQRAIIWCLLLLEIPVAAII
jgi:hypothetical protein